MKNSGRSIAAAEERDGFRFRGGYRAIDLTATLQARLKPVHRELLRTSDDLARWLVAAGLTSTPPEANDADLVEALRLREAIYALADAHVNNFENALGARDMLNAIAAGVPAIPRLSADGVELVGPASALLTTLAHEAIHLFGGEMADRLHQCQSPGCTIFFVDTSRSGARRWCSMSGCGNKAKVAGFRRRRRDTHNGG